MNPDEPILPGPPPYPHAPPPCPPLQAAETDGAGAVGQGRIVSDRSDVVRRARLRRNRLLATAMLTGMGGLFVATRIVPEPGFLTSLIQAGAAAGLGGGLVDSFCVAAV